MPMFDANGLPMTLEGQDAAPRLDSGWNRAVTAFPARGRLRRGASGLPGRAAVAGGLAAFSPGNYDIVFEQLRQAQPLLRRIGCRQARRELIARLRVAGLAAERSHRNEHGATLEGCA